MLKRFALLMGALMLMGSMTVQGQEYNTVRLIVDGEELYSDQPAVIYNDRTVVPIRAVAEAFGCQVDWDNDLKQVDIHIEDAHIYLTIGSYTLELQYGGERAETEIDTPPVIINGRTMVPIAFISEVLGYDTSWDGNTKTVSIQTASHSSESATDYNQQVTEAMGRYDGADSRLSELVETMTAQQLEEYTDISNRYKEFLDSTDGVNFTEEDANRINSLADEIEAFATSAAGDSADTGNTPSGSPVYYISPEPHSTPGGYSVVIDKDFSDMDDETAIYMLNTFIMFSQRLDEHRTEMKDDVAVLYEDYITRGEGLMDYMDKSPEDTYSTAISINGICANMAALAEGMDIDIGEDMKEYNTAVSNPLYSSMDEEAVKSAYDAALVENRKITSAMDKYYADFTSQQISEYTRINDVKLIYDLTNGGDTSIDYYRGGLIVLERTNRRFEIFADKYSIEL